MPYTPQSKKKKQAPRAPGPHLVLDTEADARRELSEALVEFARPLLGPGEIEDEQLRQALGMAMMAWNEGNPSPHVSNEMRQRTRKALVHLLGAHWESLRADYEQLLRDREELFADDPRIILNFQVLRGPDGELRVTALGALPPCDG